MNRGLKSRLHAASGGLAMATIATFLIATVSVELLGSTQSVAQIKQAILYGLALLIPAMAAAGASGFALARKPVAGLVARKLARMRIIAANGILVLVPCAAFLADRAGRGQFDATFQVVQAIEIVAGLTNLWLLSRNLRDGLAMRRPKRT